MVMRVEFCGFEGFGQIEARTFQRDVKLKLGVNHSNAMRGCLPNDRIAIKEAQALGEKCCRKQKCHKSLQSSKTHFLGKNMQTFKNTF